MSALGAAVRGLLGLFVDDGALAAAILAVVVVAGVLVTMLPASAPAAGVLLLCGCPGVLVANVVRAAQR
jgi:hypothetical protein